MSQMPPWDTIVGMAKSLGEVGGHVDALETTVRDLIKTVAAHDASDQTRHTDLLKAGEERQVAVQKMIDKSNKQVIDALKALTLRMDAREQASAIADAVADARPAHDTAAQEQQAVDAAKPLFAVLMSVPIPIWAGGAMFIAAVIGGVLGHPVKWPDPPKLNETAEHHEAVEPKVEPKSSFAPGP